jgi:hypothetical protein
MKKQTTGKAHSFAGPKPFSGAREMSGYSKPADGAKAKRTSGGKQKMARKSYGGGSGSPREM